MSDIVEELTGPEAVPQEEPKAETPEDADAELASETPQEEPQGETPDEPQPEPEKVGEDQHTVPLAVFKSMRDDLKSQIDQAMEAAKHQTPPPEPAAVPDVFEDPEGFQKYMGAQLQRTQQSVRAEMSEVMALEAYGKEAVDEAFAAVKASGEGARFLNSQHPYGEMVKWHKQQKVLQEIGDDPEAYRQKIETEVRQKIEADLAAKQAKAMAEQAPPSMAKTNGSGGAVDPGWTGPTDLDSILG